MAFQEFNAKIADVQLGFEDHGILTSFVFWEGDGGGGGFGGLNLGGPGLSIWVEKVLRNFEVSDWSKLKGTFIRVRSNGIGSRTEEIGHILKDQWISIAGIQESIRAKL
jgi:hypothetical protein